MLFDPVQIGGLDLKNRFVRSATYEGMADRRGLVTDRQVAFYETLAAGGVGLIVTGLCSVHPSGRISGFQNIISDDTALDGLRRLVSVAHHHGAKITVQVAHCGREGHLYQTYKGNTAVAPSVVRDDPFFEHPHRALTEAEIEEILEGFGAAAGRAQTAGFDAVQVHAAHAYLISQFLSPHTNRRTDGWGGSLGARFRFLKQIYRAMRRQVGPDYPIHIKLGVEDGFGGGLKFAEGKAIAGRCVDLGVDLVEVSQGLLGASYDQAEFRTGIPAKTPEAYFRGWTETIRRETRAPVVLVGGLRSIDVIQDALGKGEADLAALCRPLIREPGLINRWRRGDHRPSRCVSCNQCYEALFKGLPVHCVVEARRAKKDALRG